MELSFIKKSLAGVAAAAISLTSVGTVFAAYSDVPAGVWYEEAVDAFVDAGYLDASQPLFRGGDAANRAEFVKLVVQANGGILSTPPSVPSFSDVATGAWYFGYFEEAGKEGWVKGDGDCYGSTPCNARPSANINRAEAAALIVRSFGLEYQGMAPQFSDNASGQWYTDVIQTAADACVLQGDDSTGRVRPGDNMNRAEMVAMLYRAMQVLVYGTDCGDSVTPVDPMITGITPMSSTMVGVEFSRMLDADSAEDASMYSVSGLDVTSATLVEGDYVELMLDDNTVAGNSYTLTVTDLLTTDGVEFSDSMEFNGYSDIAPSDGTLEVSLASSNPAADTLPKGALGVAMLSVDLSASCEDDVIVDRVTLLHEGFGDESDIQGVYASIDGGRYSRKRTIKSEDQTVDVRFNMPLVVTKCDTVTVDFLTDFSLTAATSAQHNLVLELASDVSTNAQAVTGSLPLRGATFTVAAVQNGSITLDYRSVTPDEVEVGDTTALLGKFQLEASSVQDESIYAITLENNGSASDGDVTNIAIARTDGTVLTNTATQTVGDFVTLLFDPPFTILEGDRVTLEVIGDVVDGAGDTVALGLEENSDLFSVGSLYGYGVNGQLYGSQVTLTGTVDTVTIDAGQFEISIDGPAAETYTRDSDDAVLANVVFEAGSEPADVQSVFVMVQGQTAVSADLSYAIDAVMEDVQLRNVSSGLTIDGVEVADTACGGAASSCQVYRFDDFVVSGSQEFELQVDFIEAGTNPASGDKFSVDVCAVPSIGTGGPQTCAFTTDVGAVAVNDANYAMTIEGLSTGDAIKDVRPNTIVSGNYHDVATAGLTVAVQNINATDTSVRNAKDITLLRFSARAGDAEDILVTSFTFENDTATATDIQNGVNYTLMVDTDGNDEVDTVLESGVSSESTRITFDDLAGGGYKIMSEEDVYFEVHSDVASSLQGTPALRINFATNGAAASFIEAEEADDGSSLDGIACTAGSTDGIGLVTGTCAVNAASAVQVTVVPSTLYTLALQGNLFVTQDSSPTRARQVLGGAVSDSVLRLNFRAQNEDVKVEDLRLTLSGSTTSVNSLSLFLDGATTAFGTATTNNCGAVTATYGTLFCFTTNDPKLVVPEGSDVDVIVKANIKQDTAGGVSGNAFDVRLLNVSTSVVAEGYESSNPLVFNDGDLNLEGETFIGATTAAAGMNVIGNTNDVVMAKIVSITNANPDANGRSVPSGVYPVGQFTFTAANNTNSQNGVNDVVLDEIIFTVTKTAGVSASSYVLYNKADSSVTTACTGTLATITCTGLLASAINSEVDAGQSETFVLQASLSGAGASDSYQVSLQNFNSRGVNGNIDWRDRDGVTNTLFTWIEYAETVVNSTSYQNN